MSQAIVSAPLRNLRLRQLDTQFAALSKLRNVPRPPGGWIRTIRSALGMSLAQLGARLGHIRQAALQLEQRENEDRITLATLRRAADALDCDLVYALIPRRSLAEMLEQEARAMALREIQPVAHSMRLEKQGVSERETDRQVRDRAAEILRGWPHGFWEHHEP